MAASLLSVIDWDNLDQAELTTACKLLMKATQERFSIGYMKIDGSGTQNGSGAYKDIFPYGSNSPKYKLNTGDPLVIDSVELEAMLKETGRNYFDRTLWLAELGGNSVNYNGVALYHPSSNNALDPITYSSRLLELAGHTSYPDFSETVTTSEVKKWFDIVTQFKYCQRIITTASHGDEYDYYKIGEFDVELDAPITGSPGARKEAEKDYGTGDGLTLPSGTEYEDFEAAFDSLPNTDNEESEYNGTGTYDPSRPYYMRVYKSGGVPGVYHTTLCYYKMRHEIDYDTLQTEIGNTGMPKDLFRENKYTVVNSVYDDTDFTAPTYSETEDETYEADLTEVKTGTVIKLTEELPISSFGTVADSLSANSTATSAKQWTESMSLTEQPFRFVEFWDYEGGFDYYTP
jgi:hypothetical protein